MSYPLVTTPVCPSCGGLTASVPGPQGPQGDKGDDGDKGDKGDDGAKGDPGSAPISELTEPFTMPAEYGTGTAYVDGTGWMCERMIVGIQVATGPTHPVAFFTVSSITNDYEVVLYNLKQSDPGDPRYLTNPVPGTVFAPGMKLVAAGVQGTAADPGTIPNVDEYFLIATGASGFPTLSNAICLNSLSTGLLYLTKDSTPGVAGFSTVTPITVAMGGTNATAKTGAFNNLSPCTTNGDLIYFNGTNNVRLGVGSSSQVLTVSGGIPSWQTLSVATFKTYVSSELSIPSPGAAISALAHGLTGTPTVVNLYFKCTDAGGDVGYSQNDCVQIAATNMGTGGTAELPTGALYATSTHIYFTLTNATLVFISKTTGGAVNPTLAKWKLVITAAYWA